MRLFKSSNPPRGRQDVPVGKSRVTSKYPQYVYKELEHPKDFRLLSLLPGKTKDKICIRIGHYDFESNVDYLALSYWWGPNDNNQPIFVEEDDGRSTIEVTMNCYLALQQIRRPKNPYTLWVDAICINQATTIEKNQQLLLMPYLYPKSRRVVGWLGPDDGTAKLAIDGIKQWTDAGDRDREKKDDMARLRLVNQTHEALAKGGSPTLRAMTAFFSRQWFRRMWIVQEACVDMQNPPLLLCGSHELDLNSLYVAFYTMARSISPPYTISSFGESIEHLVPLMRLYGAPKDYLSLSLILPVVADRQATMPSDMIYGVLGLSARYGHQYPPPDTSLSPEQVCIRYTRAAIQVDNRLDLLYTICPTSDQFHLPSWVVKPDQMKHYRAVFEAHTTKTDNKGLKYMYDATLGRGPMLGEEATDDPILRLMGAKADCIRKVYELAIWVEEDLSSCQRWVDVHRASARLASDLRLYQLGPSYVQTGQGIEDALLRTVCANDFLVDTPQSAAREKVAERDRMYTWYFNCLRESIAQTDLRFARMAMTEQQFWGWLEAGFCFSGSRPWSSLEAEGSMPGIPRQTDEMLDMLDCRVTSDLITAIEGLLKTCYLLVTESGWIGLAHKTAQIGDEVCLLYGSTVPIILRPVSNEQHRLVGNAYVHGMMFGEFFSTQPEAEKHRKMFHIV